MMLKFCKERLKDIKTGSRDDLVLLVDHLNKYDFRILEGMVIDGKGKWYSKSKGKAYGGKFTKNKVERINKTGLLNKSVGSLKKSIVHYTRKLYNEGKISCPFSHHDLRRKYITTGTWNLTVKELLNIEIRKRKKENPELFVSLL